MNFGPAPEVDEGHSIDNNGLKFIRIVFAFEPDVKIWVRVLPSIPASDHNAITA